MSPPPVDRLRFRWSWRPHQARVLETVERHLRDRRLHIVAAPGAGKTSLGLEVFRRLGHPTLALAPTLTVRDQWLTRLGDFLPQERPAAGALEVAGWTSTDLASPAFFTVATYQALLSKTRREPGRPTGDGDRERPPSEEEITGVVAVLRGAGVRTLILDEAHHLRREWWKALDRIVSGLDDATLVSLTATPPYDATGHEWRRYEELCGPIDDEISAPELVRAGTLCPHQDFVYVVAPLADEAARVDEHETAVVETLAALMGDTAFGREVESHPWIVSPAPDPAEVLEQPELAVALLAYLRATAASLPAPLLDLLELTAGELPTLDRRWWQILLDAYLWGSTFEADEAYRRELARRLRKDGLLWRRSLRIERSRPTERVLAFSASKIDACVEIHRREREVRGDDLRLVVLADFIRDDALDAPRGSAAADLGAFPVFDAIASERWTDADPVDLAMISGRLCIIHRSRAQALGRALPDGVEARLLELPHRTGWSRVEGVPSAALVAACTRLLTDGAIRVLVGTRALLGEGWDAHVVNSLVLASYVGAFVGSNQMRGRAIRTDPARPDKVASIWHLAAVSPRSASGSLDVDHLRSRFATFVGLSDDGASIESGLARLGLPDIRSDADLVRFNDASLARLGALPEIAEWWREAVEAPETGQVVPTVRFRSPPTLAPVHVRRTLRYLLYELGWAGALVSAEIARSALLGGRTLAGALLVAGMVPMAWLAPKLLKAARLALRHAPVDGSVRQIAHAVLEALEEVGALEGEGLGVRVERPADGSVRVSLEGGTFYDQSLYADAVAEALGPVGNPRYVITRPAVAPHRGRRVDYHAVPTVLGARKEGAEALHRAWLRRVGPGEIVYTRREGGRRLLLAARARAFANQFVDPAERLDRWH